ncbi:MAG TPA: PPOX class F420-dependent oxidoreductase [Propionibacteriaceae bacterium]
MAFERLGCEQFISLTTFRRSGEPVSTPVWVAPDGAGLLVTTQLSTGKVKRLRHTSRVELRPCSRLGKVAAGVQPVAGIAEIREDERSIRDLNDAMVAKYGLMFRLVLSAERVVRRRGRGRIVLRITEPTPA